MTTSNHWTVYSVTTYASPTRYGIEHDDDVRARGHASGLLVSRHATQDDALREMRRLQQEADGSYERQRGPGSAERDHRPR